MVNINHVAICMKLLVWPMSSITAGNIRGEGEGRCTVYLFVFRTVGSQMFCGTFPNSQIGMRQEIYGEASILRE